MHYGLGLIFIFIFSVSQTTWSQTERKLYVGKNSTEAMMTFDHKVEMESRHPPTLEEARRHIDLQVLHLFGPMGYAEYKAVPKGNHEITDIKISSQKRNTYVARYHYQGTIVLENGPRQKYEIPLPNNPETIYEKGLVNGRNPCTDPHYDIEKYFWYFWNPENDGCPLKEGRDYKKVTTQIQRFENTQNTYPEYERLVDDAGVIHISLLMGMDNPYLDRNPMISTDSNASNYQDIQSSLIQLGFKPLGAWAEEQIFSVASSRPSVVPYVEELEKQDKKAKIVVRMFFGPSGMGELSHAFHYFLKDALENSSVMIYDGHSGLGEYLDLETMEQEEGFEMKPHPDRYQIYYFNSCSSYPYYNTMFFGRKASEADPNGTQNLDILTNGLSTFFYVLHDTNLAFIRAIDAWANGKARISYQKIAQEIDSGNLFGVNGDEDNE
ncbi:MAG: hypothetical protein HYY61_05360 [Deltaproteobacteria bacterium]|nr:hypothetical protein [Deltaproteobacteria bacterium]